MNKKFKNPKNFKNQNAKLNYYSIRDLENTLRRFLSHTTNVTADEFNNYIGKYWKDTFKKFAAQHKRVSASTRPQIKCDTFIDILSRKDCPFDVYGVMDKVDEAEAEEFKHIRVKCTTVNPITGEVTEEWIK